MGTITGGKKNDPRGNKVIRWKPERANVRCVRAVMVCVKLSVVLQKHFCRIRKTKRLGNCYMDSFWPQSGRDVQDNWMLRFCRVSPVRGSEHNIWAGLCFFSFTQASTVKMSERVRDGLCTLPHLWSILRVFDVILWSRILSLSTTHVIDTTMRCGFELNESYSCRRTLASLKLPK